MWMGQKFEKDGKQASGGPSETSVTELEGLTATMVFHPERKFTQELSQQSRTFPANTLSTQQAFNNTAFYSPVFYLPQSLAIYYAKSQGLSLVSAIQLARAASLAACFIVGVVALSTAKRIQPWLFAVLTLPMPMFLSSTVSQDGLLLTTTALLAALIDVRLQKDDGKIPLGIAICTFLIATAKPPYLLLALIPLVFFWKSKAGRATNLITLLASLAWLVYDAVAVHTPLDMEGVDVGSQASYMLHHLSSMPGILFSTIKPQGKSWLLEMIGNLGWLDTPLQKWFYLTAWIMILAALGVTYMTGISWNWKRTLTLLGTLVAVSGIIILGQYLTYTKVGAPIIEGVQGRYFLPLLILLPLAFIPNQKAGKPLPGQWLASWVLILFPIVSVVASFLTLQQRYF